jgi:hypothetical protein
MEPPFGYFFQLVEQSSMHEAGWSLANKVGVIDPGYHGEMVVEMRKVSAAAAIPPFPWRAVQILCIPYATPKPHIMGEFTTGSERGTNGLGSTNKRNPGYQIDEYRDPETSDSARMVPGTDQDSVVVAGSQREIQTHAAEIASADATDQRNTDAPTGRAIGLRNPTTEPMGLPEDSIPQSGVRNRIDPVGRDGRAGGTAKPENNRPGSTSKARRGRRKRTNSLKREHRQNSNRVLRIVLRNCNSDTSTSKEGEMPEDGGNSEGRSPNRAAEQNSNGDEMTESNRFRDELPDTDKNAVANRLHFSNNATTNLTPRLPRTMYMRRGKLMDYGDRVRKNIHFVLRRRRRKGRRKQQLQSSNDEQLWHRIGNLGSSATELSPEYYMRLKKGKRRERDRKQAMKKQHANLEESGGLDVCLRYQRNLFATRKFSEPENYQGKGLWTGFHRWVKRVTGIDLNNQKCTE